jgi:S-adenosylmethionine decarboxylase
VIIGHHATWDVYGCQPSQISFQSDIETLLTNIVRELGLTGIRSGFKQFQPIGVTGFILLEESHISVHTWPEHGFVALDIFSCKPFEAAAVSFMLERELRCDQIVLHQMSRGKLPEHLSLPQESR